MYKVLLFKFRCHLWVYSHTRLSKLKFHPPVSDPTNTNFSGTYLFDKQGAKRGAVIVVRGSTFKKTSQVICAIKQGYFNPLTPGAFRQKLISWTFWRFLGWILARLP